MSATIKIENYGELNITDRTVLDADSIAGATSLTVVDSASGSANKYILVGTPGGSTSEIVRISAIADATHFTVNAAANAHNRFDAIYILFGNQIRIYRAANVDGSQPDDTDFSVLTTVTISENDTSTSYTDVTGGSGYWYKFTYYDGSSETALADSFAARGGGVNQYCSIEAIRREAGLMNNPYITDADIDLRRQDAQSEIDGTLAGTYTVPFTDYNATIAKVTRLLAAGFLLNRNYGPVDTLNTNEGSAKVTEARSILKQLNEKTLILTDQNTGEDTSIQTDSGNFNMWPNADTVDADATDGGAPRQFRMSDRY